MVDAPRPSKDRQRVSRISAHVAQHGPIRIGDHGDIVKSVQAALACAGHELVPDGKFGEITLIAVKRFQSAQHLDAVGHVGTKTAAALDSVASVLTAPTPKSSVIAIAPHLAVARALSGTAEIPGPQSNPLILAWRDEIANKYPAIRPNVSWYVNDDTAWCGLFVAYCIMKGGYRPVEAPLYALNWRTFENELDEPCLGALLVFVRPGGGHVGFYEGEDASTYHVRGGNQSNTSNVARIKKDRLVATRWPSILEIPRGRIIIASMDQYTVSNNEA